MMAWTHRRETFKLYSLIAGKVAQVTRCGDKWRATVFTAKGSSSITADYSIEAKQWCEGRWQQYVRGVMSEELNARGPVYRIRYNDRVFELRPVLKGWIAFEVKPAPMMGETFYVLNLEVRTSREAFDLVHKELGMPW